VASNSACWAAARSTFPTSFSDVATPRIATRASRLALSYGSHAVGATAAVIKVLEGNAASLGVARALGAVEVGSEPSDAGGRFIVLRLALST